MFEHPEDLMISRGPVWHGTALVWKKSLDKYIIKMPVICERFCSVKFTIPETNTSTILYSTYLPTSGNDDHFLEIIETLNFHILQNKSDEDSLIIGIDSNTSSKSTKRRIENIDSFIKFHKLDTIISSLEPTFHHNNQSSESQIDHIYHCSCDALSLRFKDHICLKYDPTNLSSHDVLVAEITVHYPKLLKSTSDHSSTYTPFQITKLDWSKTEIDDYQQDTAAMLENLLETYSETELIPELCEMFSKVFVMSAEKHFGLKSIMKTHNKDNHKRFPFFSPEFRQAHKDLKDASVRWRKAGRPAEMEHPAKALVCESRRRLQAIRRAEEHFKSVNLYDELMSTFSENINTLSSKLRKYKGEKYSYKEIKCIDTLAGQYLNQNVLEGFAANTEILCGSNDQKALKYDNKLHSRVVHDNMIIFDITSHEKEKIPHIDLKQLKEILFKKLKPNKACDIFMLTVEHLRNAGDDSLVILVKLLNYIIDNINHLSSPQLNTSIASIIHKGKGKPTSHHKSYRLVRVTPLIGRIIDEHLRPKLVSLVKPIQNSNQYGFTEKVSYLMGALQRHEVEKFCIDSKTTFMGCSLDGDSAFEVVDREIQMHELYFAGERGSYWQASHYSYQNSLTRIKHDGNLSRNISEKLGVKQGRNMSSDHYKLYIAPLLKTLDDASLGVQIGPVNVSVSGVADDVYLMSDNQTKLQCLIDIASKYGHMYRIEYGAGKTKITIIGSRIDSQYYSDIQPWKMNGETINVVENNEHLGQIVSGHLQEQKNIDLRIAKSRNCLFSLLGIGFSSKCLLSPALKLHIYKTYVCPILLSGLSTFSLRTTQIEPMAIFQRKVLKSILRLSSTAPTPAIHFLTGDLPIQAKIHKDAFSLFYSVWRNPDSKIYEIVKHILKTSPDNIRTWAVHIRHLCSQYGLEDPLQYLSRDPPSRESWKELIMTKIACYHENHLRSMARTNSLMTFFNVNLLSLRGKYHPALADLNTSWDVAKARSHLKFISGNYLTYQIKAEQSGGSPRCRICESGHPETIEHIIISCKTLDSYRKGILIEFQQLCKSTRNNLNFDLFLEDETSLCQFIIDPTSMNLTNRVSLSDPLVQQFFKLSRDICHTLDKARMEMLKKMKN